MIMMMISIASLSLPLRQQCLNTAHETNETPVLRYVAMSLPAEVGIMCPADSVIAEVSQSDGLVHVGTFFLNDMKAYADGSVPLSSVSAQSSNSEGITACFSRPVAALGQAGMPLTVWQPIGMNFAAARSGSSKAASSPPVPFQHLMDKQHLCGAMVQLQATAVEGAAGVDNVYYYRTAVVAHGVLMMLAWLVLLPAGVLAARHKWMFPAPATSLTGSSPPAMWFQVHRALQLAGIALFTAGLILPFTAFGSHGGGPPGRGHLMPQVRKEELFSFDSGSLNAILSRGTGAWRFRHDCSLLCLLTALACLCSSKAGWQMARVREVFLNSPPPMLLPS